MSWNHTVACSVVAVVAVVGLGGCGSGTAAEIAASTDAPTSVASGSLESDVLAVAASYRVQIDNSFGGTVVFDAVSIVDGLIASPDPEHPPNGFVPPTIELDDTTRAAIEAGLAPMPVEWITFAEVSALTALTQPSGPPAHAVLELAAAKEDGADRQVFSVLQCGSNCFTGGTHLLHPDPGHGWTVTGAIGQQFVS